MRRPLLYSSSSHGNIPAMPLFGHVPVREGKEVTEADRCKPCSALVEKVLQVIQSRWVAENQTVKLHPRPHPRAKQGSRPRLHATLGLDPKVETPCLI